MSEEQPIRNKIIVVPQADLKRRKCLLVVLERIDIVTCAAVRETKG
jgi:hypothetical protein